MRRAPWLLGLVALSALLIPGRSRAQQATTLWIPGLAVPVAMPANFPWGATSPGPTQTQPPTGQPIPVTTGAAQSGMAPLPPGAVDGNGYLTVGFMQVESKQMLDDLVAALPADRRAKVQGIPLVSDTQTAEVNAFAGCDNGRPYMAVTLPLLRAMGHIAEAKASDEVFGTQRVDSYTQLAAQAMGAGAPIPDPAPNFYTPQEANDPRKLGRERVVFDEMVGFVVGHEIGHHYLGHTGCAIGDQSGSGLDPSVIGRIASNAIPVFNQPNEVAADINGIQDLLDVGLQRPGGLTEMGGVLTLQFFGALQRLTPSSVALSILRTHPQPQLRIPLVQQTAQQWRARHANGGGGAAQPSGGLPFPFPFPFPFGR